MLVPSRVVMNKPVLTTELFPWWDTHPRAWKVPWVLRVDSHFFKYLCEVLQINREAENIL